MATTYIDDYKGYDIVIRELKPQGAYELSTMVQSMGEEYREHMRVEELEQDTLYETLDRFIEYIERRK